MPFTYGCTESIVLNLWSRKYEKIEIYHPGYTNGRFPILPARSLYYAHFLHTSKNVLYILHSCVHNHGDKSIQNLWSLFQLHKVFPGHMAIGGNLFDYVATLDLMGNWSRSLTV